MARGLDVFAAARGAAFDIYTRTHVEAVQWFMDLDDGEADEEQTIEASQTFGELLDLMKRYPAATLDALLRTRSDDDIAPLKRMFVRAAVVASLGLRLADDEEPLRADIQTDCLIDGTWPPDSEAQEALLRAAGVPRNRTHGIIREIFLQPRAVYEADEVMRMLGISDRMFADIVDDVELRRNKGRVPIGLMLKIVEDVFGMQRIELALGEDFETFFNALCGHETVTIGAPRYVIAAARYVTDDFENASVFDSDSRSHEQHMNDIEIQIPGFTDALNYRKRAQIAVLGRIK